VPTATATVIVILPPSLPAPAWAAYGGARAGQLALLHFSATGAHRDSYVLPLRSWDNNESARAVMHPRGGTASDIAGGRRGTAADRTAADCHATAADIVGVRRDSAADIVGVGEILPPTSLRYEDVLPPTSLGLASISGGAPSLAAACTRWTCTRLALRTCPSDPRQF